MVEDCNIPAQGARRSPNRIGGRSFSTFGDDRIADEFEVKLVESGHNVPLAITVILATETAR
jgi:hypothetical protein